jgi:hypothetical protein
MISVCEYTKPTHSIDYDYSGLYLALSQVFVAGQDRPQSPNNVILIADGKSVDWQVELQLAVSTMPSTVVLIRLQTPRCCAVLRRTGCTH